MPFQPFAHQSQKNGPRGVVPKGYLVLDDHVNRRVDRIVGDANPLPLMVFPYEIEPFGFVERQPGIGVNVAVGVVFHRKLPKYNLHHPYDLRVFSLMQISLLQVICDVAFTHSPVVTSAGPHAGECHAECGTLPTPIGKNLATFYMVHRATMAPATICQASGCES